jgi:anti-anti-sigma regulatory factor
VEGENPPVEPIAPRPLFLRVADRVVVRLSGEITGVHAEQIGMQLRKAESRAAILEMDLARVTQVGSAGDTAFVMVLRTARAHDTWLIATNVGSQPLHALRQLGLDLVLEL